MKKLTLRMVTLISCTFAPLLTAFEMDNLGSGVVLGTLTNETNQDITLWAPQTGFTFILKPHEKQVVNALIFSNQFDSLVWSEQICHISTEIKGHTAQYVLMLEQGTNEFDYSNMTTIKLQKPTTVWKSFFKNAPTIASWNKRYHNSLNGFNFKVNIVFEGTFLERSLLAVTEEPKNIKTNTKSMTDFDL
ncbi:hypothetical protein Noda2021_08500 [Candidatus Dependentiae bacterium Noda2021]|nr:hypothetical protein Noda2021_08500 [Candidatus Dependentiae bacterium Noda2021]